MKRREVIRVLTVNSGSSSVRLDLVECRGGEFVSTASIHENNTSGSERRLLSSLLAAGPGPDAVVHRIVHGGTKLSTTRRVSAAVLAAIRAAAPLARLHVPNALRWISASMTLLRVPQWAAPDSAFFHALPAVAATYAIPRSLARAHGLRRLGFHGFAHRSLLRRWQQLNPGRSTPRRIVTLQLGGGCSAAAIADGKPIDTSMGFTPTEGLVMATRCGDLDPGIALQLQRIKGWSTRRMSRCLTEESGLRGLAGTGDMQRLLKRRNPADLAAVDLFTYRLRKCLGAYAAVLGGLDAVLVSGGIGEHAAEIRERMFDDLGWLGVRIDAAANAALKGGDGRISARGSGIDVWVLKSNEAEELAREAVGAMTGREQEK